LWRRYFNVIASEAKQSILSLCREVDCFALLAMTGMGRGAIHTPACVGYRALSGRHKILQRAVIGISPTASHAHVKARFDT